MLWRFREAGMESATKLDVVSLTRREEIGVITIDNPPVNAISPAVAGGLQACIESARKDASIRALVLIGAGQTFIAGADIKEFRKITSGEKARGEGLGPLLRALEACEKPIACAIHGSALGGGLELAMACHYRVAARSAQVGQPEVKLGIIPGAGGTQRLPRLAGVAKAIEMCVQGDPIKAPDALRYGILDEIVEGDLLEGAIRFLRGALAAGVEPRKIRERDEKLGDAGTNAALFAAAREAAARRGRGLLAPRRAIDAVEAATRLPFDQGLQREAELFSECLFSDQSKALVHVFFAERAASKIPDVAKDTPVAAVRSAGVVGAGTMGSGIAMVYANAGIPVALQEADQAALDRGMATIRKSYLSSVQKGRLTQEVADARLALVRPTLAFEGFGEADIVVEAVFEGMKLKKEVFAELDKVCKPDAILATNTSYLDVDEIASATSRPQRVIGNHFFAPPHVMRLLEVVRGKATGSDVIASSMALGRKLGKVGVLAGNCRGFIGNRMYALYQREAQFLVEEGAGVEAVDTALCEYGMAMGPLATGDLSGLDVGFRIRNEHRHLEQPGVRRPRIADRLCELGRFGQKTGAGWYRYEGSDRSPIPDPEVDRILAECVRGAGIPQRAVAADEIVERTIYALVNEGARLLEEGMALRASDIDVVYLYGYGFPAHRGGPMWFADTVGLPRVYERILRFESQHGAPWRPAPLLKKLAEEGRTFADFDRERWG
jgi:3-hydroxyacyl-CoA dehydrogenase